MTNKQRVAAIRRARRHLQDASGYKPNGIHYREIDKILNALEAEFVQRPKWADIGPVTAGGASLLDMSLTHDTSGIALFPAVDLAWGAGVPMYAPENVTVDTRDTSANPGEALYLTGRSGMRYWFAHIDRDYPLGTKFAKGAFLGKTVDTSKAAGRTATSVSTARRSSARAGLNQFFIHVDGGQRRPGWEGRSEAGMNPLRQRYADLIAEFGGVRCGFNMTVTRENLGELPDVLHWATENIDRVQNLSFIALRGMDRSGGKRYAANGRPIDASRWLSGSSDARELTLTTDEIYEVMISHMPSLRAAAYLGGTSRPETTKFLIILPLGSPGRNYGVVGARTVELQTGVHHCRKIGASATVAPIMPPSPSGSRAPR